jgi:hypothetical protein
MVGHLFTWLVLQCTVIGGFGDYAICENTPLEVCFIHPYSVLSGDWDKYLKIGWTEKQYLTEYIAVQ